MAAPDADTIRREFGEAVNMTRGELEDWLGTDESRAAGQHADGNESVGHRSGRRIAAILGKRKDELTDDDLAHMRNVNGYVQRHLEQRPERSRDELEGMTWTHSLRNWGHDPLK
jgi:hypothetical protein